MNKYMDLDKIANVKGKQTPKFDQVTIDGKEGKLWYTMMAGEKLEDGTYERQELSSPFECVFMIKRNRLIKTGPKGIEGFTDEYENPGDMVKYYVRNRDTGKIEQKDEDVAQALRDRLGLKTEVIQYARHKGKVVRLRAKGLSIAPNDAKDGYYDYVFGLENPQVWKFSTLITPKIAHTDNGDFYRMAFSKGTDLGEQQIKNIEEQMQELYTQLGSYEESKDLVKSQEKVHPNWTPASPVRPEKIEPDEEIDPDLIPF